LAAFRFKNRSRTADTNGPIVRPFVLQ
jgi:hypothetical protein